MSSPVTEVKKKAVPRGRVPRPSATFILLSFYSLPGILCRHHQNMFLEFSQLLVLKKCLQLKEQNLFALYLTFVGLMCFKKVLDNHFIRNAPRHSWRAYGENNSERRIRSSPLAGSDIPLLSSHSLLRACWVCLC